MPAGVEDMVSKGDIKQTEGGIRVRGSYISRTREHPQHGVSIPADDSF